MHKPELLAPAGSLDAALAALQYGADAIYLGLPNFSARAYADNQSLASLANLLAIARSYKPAKKVYVALNTLIEDGELPQLIATLAELADLPPDALIVQDLGLANLVRQHFPNLTLHASTQLATHSIASVKALQKLGFKRVVLARELSLREVANIVKECDVEIELFIHGALCYSISGICLFSACTYNRSGNRGRCAYCCREPFTTATQSTPAFPFSMRDLSLSPLLEQVVATGAHSLKIEGRMKAPLYVACVTDLYRRLIDNKLTPTAADALRQDLKTIFSRPLTTLYATTDHLHSNPTTIIDASATGHRGAPIGTLHALLRDQSGRRWLRFHTHRALEKHDGLQVECHDQTGTTAPHGKPFGFPVHQLRLAQNRRTVLEAPANTLVEVALPPGGHPHLPQGSHIFCSASQAVRRRYTIASLRESDLKPGSPVDFTVTLTHTGITVACAVNLAGLGPCHSQTHLPLALAAAQQPQQTPGAVKKAFERLGSTLWYCHTLTLQDDHSRYAPPSKLNEVRRAALADLTALVQTKRAQKTDAITARLTLPQPTTPPTTSAASTATPTPPHLTLKVHLTAPLPPPTDLAQFTTCVVALGHTPLAKIKELLPQWQAHFPQERLVLALPLITRALPHHPEAPHQGESTVLQATLCALVKSGWRAWECADLAGWQMLAEVGITPLSADWSLYGTNRAALAQIAALGVRSCVLSPENSRENLNALLALDRKSALPLPTLEVLAYQDTPLFIAETAPHLDSPTPIQLTNRRGQNFITQRIDRRWVTTAATPTIAHAPLTTPPPQCLRYDLSWSLPHAYHTIALP